MINSHHLRVTLAALTLSLTSCLPGSADFEMAINPDFNVLTVTQDDKLSWNGTPLSREQLADVLEQTATMEHEPTLRFEPHMRASYATSAQALRIIKESGVTKLGFLGNEKLPANESAQD